MLSLVRGGRSLRSLTSVSARTLTFSSTTTRRTPALPLLISYRGKVWKSPQGGVDKVEKTIDAYLVEYLTKNVASMGPQEAFIDAVNPTKHFTYSKMMKKIRALEGFLHEQGFKKGDAAAVIMPNCVEYPAIFTGVIARGGIFSGLPTLATAYELEVMLKSSKATTIFTSDVLLEKVLEATKNVSAVKTIVVVRSTDAPLPDGVHDWKSFSCKKPKELPKIEMDLDDVAILPFSSGTTGLPKGVMLTHRNFMTGLHSATKHHFVAALPIAYPEKTPEEYAELVKTPAVLYLPFYHIFGMISMVMSIRCGSAGVTMSKFDPAVFLASLQQYKSFFVYLVPPVAMFLAKHPITANFDLSNMRYALCGAAPFPVEVGKELSEKFPLFRVTQGYGLSETSVLGTLSNPKSKEHFRTAGSAVPGMEIKIVSLEDGKELKAGETGEICLKSDSVMKGYLDNPEETSRVIKDGWFHTGDIGFMNENEELNIVDRIKELIKVNGLQVAPAELENVLLSDKRIGDAAVVGVPHAGMGEAPRAFVVRADPSLTEEEVKKMVEERLAKHKWLEGGVVFLNEIPKSPAGKILRRLLPKN